MTPENAIIVSVVGAFIGRLTNKIAPWTLYSPQQPRERSWFTPLPSTAIGSLLNLFVIISSLR